jgi:hypothetical protein
MQKVENLIPLKVVPVIELKFVLLADPESVKSIDTAEVGCFVQNHFIPIKHFWAA